MIFINSVCLLQVLAIPRAAFFGGIDSALSEALSGIDNQSVAAAKLAMARATSSAEAWRRSQATDEGVSMVVLLACFLMVRSILSPSFDIFETPMQDGILGGTGMQGNRFHLGDKVVGDGEGRIEANINRRPPSYRLSRLSLHFVKNYRGTRISGVFKVLRSKSQVFGVTRSLTASLRRLARAIEVSRQYIDKRKFLLCGRPPNRHTLDSRPRVPVWVKILSAGLSW